MKKFLICVVTLILMLCPVLGSCGTENTGTSASDSQGSAADSASSVSSSGSSYDESAEEADSPEESTEETSSSEESEDDSSKLTESSYTVTLVLPEGETVMPDLDGIQAKWSNSSEVYTAYFDSYGFAYCNGLDGDYTVTIVGTIEDYGYNPNIYSTSSGKDVEIQLIAVQSFTGGDGTSHYDSIRYTGVSTGLYRFEFTEASQNVYFEFTPSVTATGYTFWLETYCDITEDAVDPTLSLMRYSTRTIVSTVTDGSDYNGSFTQNIYYELNLLTYTSGSYNSYIYVFSIETEDEDYSLPKYLDVFFGMEEDLLDEEYSEDGEA